MYKYVEDKEFLKRSKSVASNIINETVNILRRDYNINSEFFLIGSGARNLVTQNAKEPIDFDYNISILGCDDINDCETIKNSLIKAFNEILNKYDLDDCNVSKSALATKIMHFKNDSSKSFSIDLGIVAEDSGKWYRLIHDKKTRPNRYFWNEAPSSTKTQHKVDYIKECNQWKLVRDEYLRLKNHYLKRNDYDHPSFICFIEAVNNVYNSIK